MTSKDVRRMRICQKCGGAGIHKPHDCTVALELILKVDSRSYIHARCMETSDILRLPDDEIKHIRICDVSARAMQAIMQRPRV